MNYYLIILLVIIILFNYSFGNSIKEGFTKKFRQGIRPHMRSIYSTKDSFINKGSDNIAKMLRHL